jgi:hypothetical protein
VLGRDSNSAPVEHKSEVLPYELPRIVLWIRTDDIAGSNCDQYFSFLCTSVLGMEV